MLKRFTALSLVALLPVLAIGCPPGDVGEGEGDVGEGEGEGEGDVGGEGEGEVGEGEGEGDVGEGEGEGEGDVDPCPIADPCGGVDVTAVVAFGTGAVTVDGDTLTVGTSTRADVLAALGDGISDENTFRVTYCAAALRFEYVDADGTLSTTPGVAATDVVSRVLTLPRSTATASNGAAVGAPAPDGVPTAAGAIGDGELRFFGAAGLQLLLDGAGDVAQIAAFRPQDGARDIWTLPLTLEDDDQSLGGLRRGSTMGQASAVLGTAFDAEGVINVGGLVGNVLVRIWASAGVRLVGRCGQNPCGDATPISSITLSPPFVGKDTGVGVGSSRAELEADVGTGTADGDVIVYGDENAIGTGDALGVLYVVDAQCVERAAGFVFNYVNPN